MPGRQERGLPPRSHRKELEREQSYLDAAALVPSGHHAVRVEEEVEPSTVKGGPQHGDDLERKDVLAAVISNFEDASLNDRAGSGDHPPLLLEKALSIGGRLDADDAPGTCTCERGGQEICSGAQGDGRRSFAWTDQQPSGRAGTAAPAAAAGAHQSAASQCRRPARWQRPG